jgi:hypothetical protein
MWKDPIVEEVRRVRDAHAARFDYDLAAICEDFRERERRSGRKVVSLPPKRPVRAARLHHREQVAAPARSGQ